MYTKVFLRGCIVEIHGRLSSWCNVTGHRGYQDASLLFSALNLRNRSFDHSSKVFRSSWSWPLSLSSLISQKIFVSSANISIVLWTISGMSFTKTINNIGPRTLPCGMPLMTAADIDTIWAFRRPSSEWSAFPLMPCACSLWIILRCGTESKALLKSK